MDLTPPMQIAAWLGCLAFALMLFNEAAKFVDRIRGNAPHPPNEQLDYSVAQIDRRVTRLEEDSAKIWAKMEADKMEILVAGEHRAEKLHDRINAVLGVVSELRGKMGK